MSTHASALRARAALALVLAGHAACTTNRAATPAPDGERIAWAIAIHGGAGTLDRTAPAAEQAAYRASLQRALTIGRDLLARGAPALDACEAVVRDLEDDPLFNAGKGAAFNEKGGHELDASIMDGSTLACGGVAGVTTVRHPVSLARRVMEGKRHVLLMGAGAEEFATAVGAERVPNEWFSTEARRRMLEDELRERAQAKASRTSSIDRTPSSGASRFGTVGCVARDTAGRLAAATSTGGLTGKSLGRVGDSPVVGAGNYADRVAAVSGTGTGEQFLRHVVGRTIAARIQFGGETLAQAADAVVMHTLAPGDGGVIAVDAAGHLAAVYSSEGMYRGLADSSGRFDVRIFEQ